MKVGCLLIHGFTGAPYEVSQLAEYLEGEGFEVEVPTLSGHGGELHKLRGISYLQWLKDAEIAFQNLKRRCDKIIVVGFSMGGLLAINLVNRYDVNGLVTLSAPIFVWDLRQMGLNLLFALRSKEYRRIQEYFSRASSTPLSAVQNFRSLLKQTKKLIPQVTVPTLIVQGKRDDTVKAKSADFIYNSIGSQVKRIHYLPESSHLVCCGPEKEQVFQLVHSFVAGI